VRPGRFGDRRRLRVGLLGGSFNPAHDGHRHIALGMRRHLRLDQVWLLVSPGNPLKAPAGMAPFSARLASARGIADGRRIIASDIESQFGTRFTVDTLAALRRRFPRMRFVWLMGADGMASLPHWRDWRRLVQLVPIAVHTRLGADPAALTGAAAHLLRHQRLPPRAAAVLADCRPPAWTFLPLPRHAASATALREAGLGLNTAPPDTDPSGKD
jgi:nicotinate-nucleotide adenylyltransferase